MPKVLSMSLQLFALFKRPLFLIIGMTLAVHGWLLLNDGMHWDGLTQVYLPIVQQDWDRLYNLFSGYGYPIRAYEHWVAAQLGGIIWGHQVVTLIAILLGAYFTYQVCWQSGAFSTRDSLWIALLGLAFPAYRTTTELIMMPYSVGHAAFFLGLWMVLVAERQKGAGHWLWRIVALLILYFSFWIYSFLVFFYGFVLLLAWGYCQKYHLRSWQGLVQYGRQHLDFVALPLFFWGMLQVLFPQPAYYQPSLSGPIVESVIRFLQWGITAQFIQALIWLLDVRVLVVLAVLQWVLWRTTAREDKPSTIPTLTPPQMVLFGVLLLMLGILPYVMIGKSPLAIDGGTTRHNLLVGLPVAIMLVGGVRWGLAARPRMGAGILLGFLCLFGLLYWNDYMGWQARWAKNRAIIQALQADNAYQNYAILWIDDQFPLGPQTGYPPYEWSGLFTIAGGGERQIGLDYRYAMHYLTVYSEDTTQRSYDYLRQLDLAGCQTILTIREGPQGEGGTWGISLDYWRLRLFQPDQVEGYLQDLVQLQYYPIAAPQATHCPFQPPDLHLAWDWPTQLRYVGWVIHWRGWMGL